MKKIGFIGIFILSCVTIMVAQTKVYKGTSTYSSDIICNLKEGKVYKKTSTYSSDILLNIKDAKLYKHFHES